jgi:hypothetical protein
LSVLSILIIFEIKKMKKCFKCGVEKELSEFYIHSKMKDGHLNKCKSCAKKDSKTRTNILKNDNEWIEKERERGREKYIRLDYKKNRIRNPLVMNPASERYRNKYPEKRLAENKSQGIVSPDGLEKHHWSYRKEHQTDLIFLTMADHKTAHRFMIYDAERFMYRTLKGILLDTKIEHEKYIKDCIAKNEKAF